MLYSFITFNDYLYFVLPRRHPPYRKGPVQLFNYSLWVMCFNSPSLIGISLLYFRIATLPPSLKGPRPRPHFQTPSSAPGRQSSRCPLPCKAKGQVVARFPKFELIFFPVLEDSEERLVMLEP